MNFPGPDVQGNLLQGPGGSECFREPTKREPRRNVIRRGKFAAWFSLLIEHRSASFLQAPELMELVYVLVPVPGIRFWRMPDGVGVCRIKNMNRGMRIFHRFQTADDTHLGIHDSAGRPIETLSDVHINFTLLHVPDDKRGSVERGDFDAI